MADLQNAQCTCPRFWRGYLKRPLCILHEIARGMYEDLSED